MDFKESFNVCPRCAMGLHDHHQGHDCKNLIPEGQCSCHDGDMQLSREYVARIAQSTEDDVRKSDGNKKFYFLRHED